MSELLPQTDERRAYVRYRRRLDVLWQMLGLPPRDMISGKVLDLSVTGVGLLVDQPFAEEAHLMVRLPSATRGWTTHLVRVQNCRPVGQGCYKLGCSFARPMTPGQLQDFMD
ncbi:MAG: PilZ domain-containing protein [Gemmataceae bacterium]